VSNFSFRSVIARLVLGCCFVAVSYAQEAAEGKAEDKKTSETKAEAPVAEAEAKVPDAKAEDSTEKKSEAKAVEAQAEKKTESSPTVEKNKTANEPKSETSVNDHKSEPVKEPHSEETHGHASTSSHGHGSGNGHGDSHGHGLTAENTDLSHGNGTSQLNSPAEFRFDLAIATALVFFVLLGILTKFAWGPISQALDQREHHIADMIATAEKNALASEHRMKELESQLAAQAESAREGEIQKEKIIAQAQQAAEHEKNRALADIRDAKNLALREIAQKSVNTAVDLAKNIIRREVKPEDHKQLIQDSLAQFNQN
jgi:F-type H+-transporting ATPase subunit b